jgi:hypothetical protein
MLIVRIALATVLLTNFAWGQSSEIIHFSGAPPEPRYAPILGNTWLIYARGQIDADAGKRLERFLSSRHVPATSFLYLDSPGGSVTGGMDLGRVIRKYRLRTEVGVQTPGSTKISPGGCYSACALSFLGGEFRFLKEGSRYGVHRFAFQNPSPELTDIAQILSAAIVEYIRSMDVDPALFSLSVSAGREEMFEPTRQQLLALNVVNNGRTRPKWAIESIDAGIYLKGEQNTIYGINKFILACTPQHNVTLFIIFDAQNRDDLILGFPIESLVINGKPLRIDNARIKKQVNNGLINAAYKLSDAQVALIRSARTVGVTMQGGVDAPVFFGFDSMPFEEGAAKLPGFLSVCQKN